MGSRSRRTVPGTLVLPSGPKLTNTERKLFRLSKYAPVGMMVYGASRLMGVPWETVIKTYRQGLKTKTYEHLEDYASDFISFLEREELLFPGEVQSSYAGICIETGFRNLRNEIDEEVNRITFSVGSIKYDQIKTLVSEKSLKFLEEVEKSEYLRGFGSDDADRFTKDPNTRSVTQAVLETAFDNIPIGELTDRVLRAGALVLCNLQNGITGISRKQVAGGSAPLLLHNSHYEGEIPFTAGASSQVTTSEARSRSP